MAAEFPLPDTELGKIARDRFVLQLADVQHQRHKARGVSVVVGLVAVDPAAIQVVEDRETSAARPGNTRERRAIAPLGAQVMRLKRSLQSASRVEFSRFQRTEASIAPGLLLKNFLRRLWAAGEAAPVSFFRKMEARP